MYIDDCVLFSIKPRWVNNICNFDKFIEVRKTIPKLKPPFKCYIYCTKDKHYPLYLGPFGPGKLDWDEPEWDMQGKVVGEFICDQIFEFSWDDYNYCYNIDDDLLSQTCLTQEDLKNYGKGKTLYGIHISKLDVYLLPKPLNYLTQGENKVLQRPPQAWFYVHKNTLFESS